jgi:hypothetical protein
MPGKIDRTLRQLQRRELQRRALAARLSGATYEAIARELGYRTASAALRVVDRALIETAREPADEVRLLELARLDRLLLALWAAAVGPDVPLDQKLRVVDRVLAIMERRAAYQGLDAPARVDIEAQLRAAATRDGLDPDEMVREAQLFLREQRR